MHRPRFKTSFISLFTASLVALSVACTGPSSSPEGRPVAEGGIPELTEETIHERIDGKRVFDIPVESGTGEPISWRFFPDEPKEITIVEKQIDGTRATFVLDVKTRSGPKTQSPRYLAGQIRIDWELRTGWVLRRWEIVNIENISMKYKNLPKPEANTPPASGE